MTVTLNLPPDMERAFLAEAQAEGMSLDEWVREVLVAWAAPRSFSPRKSLLWKLRKDAILGDVSIKELIAEDRE
jgi:hypothetical protein